ncbi:MAG: MFS transporter [Deltaproteobacteria bacterium]|uniref:MFS transporter n=1 Tax=Candidatus Zymogenus saltonus TaxID=2844893 RepID=A0A9D8PK05_9DELT|nr:MFS transporter [Candidatus Zymogenus saltonus]
MKERLSLGAKLGYGIGDYSFNLAYQTAALFFLFYLTDVYGVAAGVAGIVIMVSKVWDAVSDPMMGYITDHTKSRWGSKRPYLLFGAIPLGVMFFLIFYSPDFAQLLGIDDPAKIEKYKVIYITAVFILFCTAITIVNVPYGALTADLTQDSHERSVLTGYRMVFAIIGALFAAAATKILVGLFGSTGVVKDGQEVVDSIFGFRMMGLVYMVLIVVVVLATFFSVKERGGAAKKVEAEKESVIDNLKVIFTNNPFLILISGTILNLTAVLIMAAVVNYFFKYNLDREDMVPIAFLCLFVTAILFMPFFVWLSKKTSKKFTYNVGMGSLSGVLVLIFFFGDKSIVLTIVFFVMAGAGMATNWLSAWSMVPDTIEYSEWKTGIRREGVIYGAFLFGQKLPVAIAAFIAGQTLKFVEFVPNVAQTPEALLGIKALLTLVPIGFILLGIVIISRFPISAGVHRKILEEIEAKR